MLRHQPPCRFNGQVIFYDLAPGTSYTAQARSVLAHGGGTEVRSAWTAQLTQTTSAQYNLLPIDSAGKLNAMRYDWDGNGVPERSAADYQALFGDNPCPGGNCTGYKLTADIDLSSCLSWVPIELKPYSKFIFDGQGHTIENLRADADAWEDRKNFGLFLRTYWGDIIKRVHFTNAYMSGRYGGIVAQSINGLISQVSAEGTVHCGSTCGGLAYRTNNGGLIVRSSFTGDVTSYEVRTKIGGLVGWNTGGIYFSYAQGNLQTLWRGSKGGLAGSGSTDGFIVASYAANNNHGLIGSGFSPRSIDSFWDSDLGPNSDSHGGRPATTSQLQSPTTYTGPYAVWDNPEVVNLLPMELGSTELWHFGASSDYPTLRRFTRPQGVALAKRNQALEVTWQDEPGVTFDIHWRNILSTSYQKVDNASTPYALTGLNNSRTYEVVVCYDEKFPSDCSSPLTESPALPPSPDGLEIDGIRVGLKAIWNPVPEAIGYEYQYGLFDQPGLSTPVRVTTNSATATGLTAEEQYVFRVYAVFHGDLSGNHDFGTATPLHADAPGPPDAPTFRSVDSSSTEGRLHVKWQTPSETGTTAIINYILEYSLSNTYATRSTIDMSQLSSDPDSTAYIKDGDNHTHVTVPFNVGSDVHYRIRAVNGSGNGEWSDWATGAVAPNRQIKSLTLTQNPDATITLSWSQLSGDTGWRLERQIRDANNDFVGDPAVGANGVVTCITGDDPDNIGNSPDCALGSYTTPAGSELQRATTYRWSVRVRDANNEFRESTYRQLLVPEVDPANSLEVSLTDRSKITLSWTHGTNPAETRYEIANKTGATTDTFEHNCPTDSVSAANPCTYEIDPLTPGTYDVSITALHQYGYRSTPYPSALGMRYITGALTSDPVKPSVTATGRAIDNNRAAIDFTWTKPATGFPSSFDHWDAVRVQKRERDSDGNWEAWDQAYPHVENKDNPTATTWTNLTRNQEYSFRLQLRAKIGRWWGPWSDAVELTTPAQGMSLSLPNGGTETIQLNDGAQSQGASGASGNAAWSASVLTWHIPTGTCRSGALNERARNKLTGTFDGNTLTVTAGDDGAHILMLTVTAEVGGETVSHSFKVEVGDVDEHTIDVSAACDPSEEPPVEEPPAEEPPNEDPPAEDPLADPPSFDYELAHGESATIDLAADLGEGADWSTHILTWHIPSGTCRDGALNERARNKLTGAFEGDTLTVTAGDTGAHILLLTLSGNIDGETTTRTYKIAVGEVNGDTPDPSKDCESS